MITKKHAVLEGGEGLRVFHFPMVVRYGEIF